MMRVISWNVNWRTGLARDQGRLLRELGCDIVILQEVNRKSAEALRDAAGLAWMIVSAPPAGSTVPRHQRLVAVGGTQTSSARRLDLDAPVPERVLAVEAAVAGLYASVVSYYAPPGVNWGRVKVDQALTVADWLCERTGPMIIGADANTPKFDPVDDAGVRTHWHTGDRRLNGSPGDDDLWGPSPRHRLKDCLRTWLAADRTRATSLHPDGPLAVSHYTGKRKARGGTPRRFDSIWVTPDFKVRDVQYLSHEIGRLSDHAPVVADLDVG
jgi:exonuclease III